MAWVQFVFKFTRPENRLMAERSWCDSSTATVMASGGEGFNRSLAARKRDANAAELRTLNPAWRPLFSQWGRGRR